MGPINRIHDFNDVLVWCFVVWGNGNNRFDSIGVAGLFETRKHPREFLITPIGRVVVGIFVDAGLTLSVEFDDLFIGKIEGLGLFGEAGELKTDICFLFFKGTGDHEIDEHEKDAVDHRSYGDGRAG